MRAILIAIGFLTIIPVKIKVTPLELGRSMLYFPLVGLFIGALLVLVNQGASLLFPPLVVNLLVVSLLVIITGAIHLDGLADTLDGFYGGKTKEEILTIIRDSRVGVMGVIGIVLVLTAKWATLCEIPDQIKDIALLLSPTLGRWSIVLAGLIAPYAGEGDGLGRPFAKQVEPLRFWMSGFFVLIASLILFGMDGIIILLLVVLMVIGIVKFIKKKIGGMTGDTFGLLCEIVEVMVLLALLAIRKKV